MFYRSKDRYKFYFHFMYILLRNLFNCFLFLLADFDNDNVYSRNINKKMTTKIVLLW